VKWKLSTSAMLMMASGALTLTPIRSTAQQIPAANAAADNTAQSASTAAATAPAYDPAAILNGSTPGATEAERNEAAERLLSRHTAEAQQALLKALIAPDEISAAAVARALAQDPNPDPAFIDPLFPLLDNPKTAPAAGRALAGYKNDSAVLTRLIDRAGQHRNARIFMREAAIRAIGTIPEKRGAATLVQLLESPDESPAASPEIHAVAAEALKNLTGLDQNGEDAARWSKWWDTVRATPDAQFRDDVNSLKAARLDRLNARYEGLVGEVKELLRDEYLHKTKTSAERQGLMLAFLQSPDPEIRKLGIGLLSDDVEEGRPLSAAELQRLRDMIADSDPSVRRAVAKAIYSVNDPDALNALLAQLRVEPDTTVRAGIAAALGPIRDLRAVHTLIKLLSDDSLDTATAAAGALEELANDKLPSDTDLARQTADALKNAVFSRTGTPGSDDFRAACIRALAALKNAGVVQALLEHKPKLMNSENEGSSPAVRRAMLIAIGALNDPKSADMIVVSLDDRSPEVVEQAIQSLKENPRAADFVDNVGRLLQPDPALGPTVSDAAWDFMQAVFPSLSEGQLETWAQRLKGDPSRQLFALQALASKQVEQKELDRLAVTDFAIGEDYMALKQWGAAAASYDAALTIYDGLPNLNNQQAEVQSLIGRYMDALLNDANYAKAVRLAADRIKRDPGEQHTMGAKIYGKAQELADTGKRDNLLGAQQLIDLATRMASQLDDKHQTMLNDLGAQLKKRTSTPDGAGPAPQQTGVDGR
jgi:HEAT repeat protein